MTKMTDDKIRDIFSRFEHLNLIVLIEDLGRGIYAIGNFLQKDELGTRMCPLQHGWSGRGLINANWCFIFWFDGAEETKETLVTRESRLARILKSILQERMDDADVVQGVIQGAEELVAV